jgi:cytochrome b subunit of formate dehydrogenase
MFIMSGMAHHPADRTKIESEVQFIFIGITILIIFAIISGRIIFKTGKEISRSLEIVRKNAIRAAILSVIGILLNLTAFAITVWYLYPSGTELN